jgi:hypothetical protein
LAQSQKALLQFPGKLKVVGDLPKLCQSILSVGNRTNIKFSVMASTIMSIKESCEEIVLFSGYVFNSINNYKTE